MGGYDGYSRWTEGRHATRDERRRYTNDRFPIHRITRTWSMFVGISYLGVKIVVIDLSGYIAQASRTGPRQPTVGSCTM